MHSQAPTQVLHTDMQDPHEDEESHELLHDVLHEVLHEATPHDDEESQLVVIPQDDELQSFARATGAVLANKRLSNRYFFDIKESLLFHKGLDTYKYFI